MYKNNFVDIYVQMPIEVNFLPTTIITAQNQGKYSSPTSASLQLTNPFHATDLSIPPENIRKPEVSGVINKWHEMG